ncbi:Protein of unknown function [Pyronema omphalodes CBS 100304]|uniref:Uncharacterized protein n=1 Tax=Pyronema omphalodes (strain CBS 100304) TaxID=1076935 RepID=U4KUR0_PYROM|nr:Protein of unknown function [Pyronema omphalodes CBS 100304]
MPTQSSLKKFGFDSKYWEDFEQFNNNSLHYSSHFSPRLNTSNTLLQPLYNHTSCPGPRSLTTNHHLSNLSEHDPLPPSPIPKPLPKFPRQFPEPIVLRIRRSSRHARLPQRTLLLQAANSARRAQQHCSPSIHIKCLHGLPIPKSLSRNPRIHYGRIPLQKTLQQHHQPIRKQLSKQQRLRIRQKAMEEVIRRLYRPQRPPGGQPTLQHPRPNPLHPQPPNPSSSRGSRSRSRDRS